MEQGEGGHPAPLLEDVRSFLEGLDTGDLVLFDRPCLKMGSVFGAMICAGAKTVSGCPFDHIGVVVRDEAGENMLIEASFSGVNARPLCERLRRSSASQICVRRLQTHRTEEMRAAARDFASEVAHLPYKSGAAGTVEMMRTALRLRPGKELRRRQHARAIRWAMSVARLEQKLMRLDGEAESEAYIVLRESLDRAIAERDNAVALLATSSAGQPTTFNGVVDDSNSNSNSREPPSQPSDASTTKVSFQPSTRKQEPPLAMAPVPSTSGSDGINDNGKNGFFCSELVAALYQRLGLLDAPFPSSSDYVPADFAQELVLESIGGSSGAEPETFRQAGSSHHTAADIADGGGLSHHSRVVLLRGAVLGPGRWIRGEPPKQETPPYLGGSGEPEEWKKREDGVMSSGAVGGSRGLSQRVPFGTVASFDSGDDGDGTIKAVTEKPSRRNLERSEVSADSLPTFSSSDMLGRGQEGGEWNIASTLGRVLEESTQQQRQEKVDRSDDTDLSAWARSLNSAAISSHLGRYSLIQSARMAQAAEDYSLQSTLAAAVRRFDVNTTRVGAAGICNFIPSGDRHHRAQLDGALMNVFDGVAGLDFGAAGILLATAVAVSRRGANRVIIKGSSMRAAATAAAGAVAAMGMITTVGVVWGVEREGRMEWVRPDAS